MNYNKNNIIYLVLTILILVCGTAFWVSDLESDPPMYYSGFGQSLSTDATQYVYHARNKILFDDFDPFDYTRWIVYQYSLTSLISYIWFSITEVSYKNANLVGLFLSLGGLILMLFAFERKKINQMMPLLAILFLSNVTLITYGRLSYLENGLIFITGLFFLTFIKFSHKIWKVILAGLVAALAMSVGKLFGAFLLPILLLSIYFTSEDNKWKEIGIAAASFLISTVLISLVLYGLDITAAFGYIGEQSYGLRGFPEGLSSPWGFFERLISFGYINRLFYINIDLCLFLFFSALILSYRFNQGHKFRDLPKIGIISFFWTVIVILGLMPLNYSPMRYSLFLIPGIIIFFISVCSWNPEKIKKIEKKSKLTNYIFLLIVTWHSIFQIISLLFYRNNAPIRMITWTTLVAALILTYLIKILFEKKSELLKPKIIQLIFLVLILFSAGNNIYHIDKTLLADKNKNILEANKDLASIVAPNAVISGPYAPVLTIDNNLQSFIHLFGVVDADTAFFNKYPITHIAVDVSNMLAAEKAYPGLKEMLPITTYWIRDFEVRIYNISKLFQNSEAAKYQETQFEIAMSYSYRAMNDKSVIAMTNFVNEFPDSKSGNMMMANILFNSKKFQEMLTVITKLTKDHPTDFSILIQCARYFQIYGLLHKDNNYITLAQKYYEKSTLVNPYKANLANDVFQQTNQQFQSMLRSQAP